MNNHHDIVYVKSDQENYDTCLCCYSNIEKEWRCKQELKPLKDVFVFTKEELNKRDKENFELGRASFENQIGKEKASEWYGSMKVKPSDK